jgi:hypothetical protein
MRRKDASARANKQQRRAPNKDQTNKDAQRKMI